MSSAQRREQLIAVGRRIFAEKGLDATSVEEVAARAKVSGSRRRGGLVKVAVQATDASGTGAQASGLNLVHIRFGDGSRTVTGLRAVHRYGHSGPVTVRVSASDKAGNAIAVTRRITIRR